MGGDGRYESLKAILLWVRSREGVDRCAACETEKAEQPNEKVLNPEAQTTVPHPGGFEETNR